MTGEEIFNFIKPEVSILIPVLIILGRMIKAIPNILDWTIPFILTFIGMVMATLIICLQEGITATNVMNGSLQGILTAGMAVYVHELYIQARYKRKIDKKVNTNKPHKFY